MALAVYRWLEVADPVGKVVRALRARGVRITADLVSRNLNALLRARLERRFDRTHHVDTTGEIELEGLTIDSANKQFGIHYEPTPVRTLRAALARVPAPLDDFVFVDFGSGKGRALLVASEYRFKRIIGVEFARELHEIACANVRAYRSRRQRCFAIEPVCGDATRFAIPDEQTVFYLYHPFEAPVMAAVFDNIERSYLATPRKMFVIYYQERLRLGDLIERMSFLRRVQVAALPVDLANGYRRRLFEVASPYRTGVAIYETAS